MLHTNAANQSFQLQAQRRRYAFVCGLHRSGTSLIARTLAQHPMVSGFANTGVIEDEGQFLQSVFPLEAEFGGAGRFGFDPRAHMTKDSDFNTTAIVKKLHGEWQRYWDMEKSVLLEKTPSNLLRMRLLSELFEPSFFIVVTRHPIAASLATMKWTEGNLFSLISHWVHCYGIARSDAALVKRVLWVSYEAFVADPHTQLKRMLKFLELPPHTEWDAAVRDDNPKYFALWQTRYFGDANRAIEQQPPAQRRAPLTRLRDRLARNRGERALPEYRRRANRGDFHDAQDAVSLFEPAVQEFGYSMRRLAQFPREN